MTLHSDASARRPMGPPPSAGPSYTSASTGNGDHRRVLGSQPQETSHSPPSSPYDRSDASIYASGRYADQKSRDITPKIGRSDGADRRSPTPSHNSPAVTALVRQEPPKGRTLSCSECKRRKIKCDRECPCGPCILRNDQARCKPVIRWEAGCSLSEFTVLQNRVTDLEERLDSMQMTLLDQQRQLHSGTSIAPPIASTSAQMPRKPLPSTITVEKFDSDIGQSNATGATLSAEQSTPGRSGEDDAVMMLEDFAMGNRANARRAAQKLVPRPGILQRALSAESPDVLRLETAASQRSGDSAADVAYRYLRISPPAEVVREIVNYYFDHIEWHTRCLHRPSYMQDLETLLSLNPATSAQTVRPTFLCIHFMVLCIAIHLCSGEEARSWGFEREPAIQLCDTFFAAAQQLLWASDFIGSHQVEHLQAVVLMSVYAYNIDDQADAAYALVGASIKIAQNLALNRLDDPRFLEKERQKGKVPVTSAGQLMSSSSNVQQNYSPLERELGKRVWWYLIWLDWSHSLSHGGCYAIHPAHNKTSLPANVNDEELVRDGLTAARSIDVYTTMSFSIWRSQFLLLYRETIDLHNSPTGMTYPQLLEMDTKFMGLLNKLPPYFQVSTEDSSNWRYGDSCHDMELLSIQITAYNRLLRLHRPFLARGLMEKTSISRRRCVDSAYKILAFMRHAKDHAPILVRQWLHIYYAFAGALVLFLDLCYDEGGDSPAARKKRQAIREAVEICSAARHLSSAAKNTHNLLSGLLQAETDLRVHQHQEQKAGGGGAAGAGKRKRSSKGETSADTASPFSSLVERVLVDAAAKNGSGESTSSSLGRSPSEYGAPSGLFDPPLKRHSTSFVRDRAHSHTSATQERYGRSSPLASSGAGHGGYYSKESGNTPYSYQAGLSNTGTFSSTMQPTSPWGTSSLRGTAGGNSGNGTLGQTPGGLYSPSAANYGPGPFGSPSMVHDGSRSGSGAASSFGPHASNGSAGPGSNVFGPQQHHTQSLPHVQQTSQQTLTSGMAAATTNGLTSLLDEDIFSGVFSNQQIENNSDWESMLASVALLPNPTSTPQQ